MSPSESHTKRDDFYVPLTRMYCVSAVMQDNLQARIHPNTNRCGDEKNQHIYTFKSYAEKRGDVADQPWSYCENREGPQIKAVFRNTPHCFGSPWCEVASGYTSTRDLGLNLYGAETAGNHMLLQMTEPWKLFGYDQQFKLNQVAVFDVPHPEDQAEALDIFRKNPHLTLIKEDQYLLPFEDRFNAHVAIGYLGNLPAKSDAIGRIPPESQPTINATALDRFQLHYFTYWTSSTGIVRKMYHFRQYDKDGTFRWVAQVVVPKRLLLQA